MEEKTKYNGFTLVELLVVIGILAILVVIASIGWDSTVRQKRLKTASEALYNTLKISHSDAIKKTAVITVSFSSGTSWCVGISDSGNCDCSTGGSCTVGGVETLVNSNEYPGVSLSLTGFTGATNKYVSFDGVRGVASNSGTAVLSLTGFSSTLTVNKMGLVSVCSNTVNGYPSC